MQDSSSDQANIDDSQSAKPEMLSPSKSWHSEIKKRESSTDFKVHPDESTPLSARSSEIGKRSHLKKRSSSHKVFTESPAEELDSVHPLPNLSSPASPSGRAIQFGLKKSQSLTDDDAFLASSPSSGLTLNNSTNIYHRPRSDFNIAEQLSFTFMNKIIEEGKEKDLRISQYPPVESMDDSNHLGMQFLRSWNAEKSTTRSTGKVLVSSY
jgi:hypothetical protein